MNTKHTATGILVVIAILVSSSILAAENSSAEGEVSFDKYYYNQLTPDQKLVYDKLCELKADTVTVSGTDGDHYIEVAVSGVSAQFNVDDAARAWEATKLDANRNMDWAFWTWTLSDVKPTVSISSASPVTLHIAVPDQFATDSFIKNAVAAVNTAIDKISVSGDSVSEKIRSINKLLTSDPYKVTDTTEGHLFARTIYAIAEGNVSDGSYYLTTEAYAAVFKALCDKSGVQCTQVYGTNGNCVLTAWNIVCIDSKAYAVDAFANAGSSNKESWLAAGTYTVVDGNAFGKVHNAFSNSVIAGLTYDFRSETLNVDGYSWPEEKDLIATITEYAPWIFTGLICLITAIALVVMAKKGAFN